MEYATLGKTGLQVSKIALGAAWLGSPEHDEARVERVLHAALDHGINFIDTAAMYRLSEERIGERLGNRQDEFAVATKCGNYRTDDGRLVEDYSPEGIVRIVDRSRRRLKRDVIDVVQFHGLPPVAQTDAAFAALLSLKERGYARFVGVSADGPAAAAFVGKPTVGRDAAEIARRWPVDTWQLTYNFLSPEAAKELMPALRAENIGTIVKRPISNVVWNLKDEPQNDLFRKPWLRAQELPLQEMAGELPVVEFALLSLPRIPSVQMRGSSDE